MKNSEHLKVIEKKLPRGSKKIIAETTGLSYHTVCRFFKSNKSCINTKRLITSQIRIILTECNNMLEM